MPRLAACVLVAALLAASPSAAADANETASPALEHFALAGEAWQVLHNAEHQQPFYHNQATLLSQWMDPRLPGEPAASLRRAARAHATPRSLGRECDYLTRTAQLTACTPLRASLRSLRAAESNAAAV